MHIDEFIARASGRVRIELTDGSVHTGRFRTDILSRTALSVFFIGEVRDISLPIDMITGMEPLGELRYTS